MTQRDILKVKKAHERIEQIADELLRIRNQAFPEQVVAKADGKMSFSPEFLRLTKQIHWCEMVSKMLFKKYLKMTDNSYMNVNPCKRRLYCYE